MLEKLVFATVNEQRAARRWRIFWRFTWLAFLGAVAWALFVYEGGTPSKSAPHTAVVDIKGEIAGGAEASAELVVAAMRSAFEDEGSQAVVLLINSPLGATLCTILRQFDLAYANFKGRLGEMGGISYEEGEALMAEGREIVMAFSDFTDKLCRRIHFRYYTPREMAVQGEESE